MAATSTLRHGLTVTEVAHIAGIGRAEWDSLASGASFYSSHAWLAYVEHHGDCDPRYLLVHHGHRLVGALPAYRFHDDMPSFYSPELLAPGTERIRPVLLGGTRLGYVTEFLLHPELDHTLRSGVVRLVLDRLRDEPTGLAAMLYLTDDALDLARPHLSTKDHILTLDARARLPVDPTGLAGYSAGGSRKRRARAHNEMQRFRDTGCRVEVLRLSDCHQHLGQLAAQVLRRYGHDITAATVSDRVAAQVPALDGVCRVLVARQGERIVGFTQFFGWNGTLYARLHGVDDALARTASLYFNLTYYHAIEYAAANGYTTIDLGCDSYEAKVLRGAHLEPLWGLILRPGWDRSTTDRLAARSRSTLDSLAAWDPAVRTPTAQRAIRQTAWVRCSAAGAVTSTDSRQHSSVASSS